MTNRQAAVVIVGLLLGLVIGVFPPRVHRDTPALRAPRGCLFSASLYLHHTHDPVTQMGSSSTLYAIDRDRLLIEWAALAMSVAAVVVACRRWREEKA